MNLKKMLLLASMAMAAVAFAAPAAAQATVKLTDPDGVPLKKGAKVTATSTNLQTHTDAGTLDCALVTIHAEVTSPGPTHVTLKPEGEVTTETCKLTAGELVLPVTIHDGTVGTITIETDGSGSAAATFVSTIFNEEYPGVHNPNNVISHCHFAGTVGFQATNETDILHAGPSVLTATAPTAVPCDPKTGTIEGSFTLETSNGTEVTIDHS